jgi:hypothetical protein
VFPVFPVLKPPNFLKEEGKKLKQDRTTKGVVFIDFLPGLGGP